MQNKKVKTGPSAFLFQGVPRIPPLCCCENSNDKSCNRLPRPLGFDCCSIYAESTRWRTCSIGWQSSSHDAWGFATPLTAPHHLWTSSMRPLQELQFRLHSDRTCDPCH